MADSIPIQLKKGVLELCVLALLSRADGYAYDIASRLAEGIDMGEGTIYPLMRRMQDDGLVATYLVESASGPPRKYYRLTEVGRISFTKQKAEWSAFARAVDAILGDAPNLGEGPGLGETPRLGEGQ
jgi:PadR family transcriptional regulator PadR